MDEPLYSAKYLLGSRSFTEKTDFTEEEMRILEADVANTKRFCEWLVMVPGFKEEFEADPEGTVKKHAIHVNAREMIYLYNPELAKSFFGQDAPLPDSVLNYAQFINNKLFYRDELQKKGCVPNDPVFKKWRERQVNRCWGEFGPVNGCMIHTPLTYELAVGCSVGCPFCGLNAGRLTTLFRYTEENAALWRGVLQANLEIIGEAARDVTCYYATEPLDNPDYEKLLEEFFAVNGYVPQITTAVPLRDLARTKAMIGYMQQHKKNYYRFSVRSLEDLYTIFREFSAEELLLVELLPQYPEAPSSCFVSAGRAREHEDEYKKDLSRDPITGSEEDESYRDESQTIACISGFVVNMAERSIRLVTPCNADEKHPTGEYLLDKLFFTDAEDYRRVIKEMIATHMNTKVPRDRPLRTYPYFSVKEDEGSFSIKSRAGYEFRFEKDGKEATKRLCELLVAGESTRAELADILLKECEADPLNVFWSINQLWNKGVIMDEQLCAH